MRFTSASIVRSEQVAHVETVQREQLAFYLAELSMNVPLEVREGREQEAPCSGGR
jgi:hypothetical protein